MKIKIDQYIANKISEVAAITVVNCINENKITAEFELADIKGKVEIGISPYPMPGSCVNSKTYSYNVQLFDHIILVMGAPLSIMDINKRSRAQSIVKHNVMLSLGAMINQAVNPIAIQQKLADTVNTTLQSPNTEVKLTVLDDLEFNLQYHQVDDQHKYFIDISTATDSVAKYYNYGKKIEEVNPFITGTFNLCLNAHAIYFRNNAPKEFYITENTTFGPHSAAPLGHPLNMGGMNPPMFGNGGVFNSNLFYGHNTNAPYSHF